MSSSIPIFFLLAVVTLNAQTTFVGEVRVNDDEAGARQIAPQAAIAPNGTIYVLWTDFRSSADGEIYITTSTDGGLSFATPRPLAVARGALAGLQRGAQIVVDRMGYLHMVWQERTSLGKVSAAYSRSINGGATFSEPQYIAADSGRRNQDFPSIAVDSSGNPFICWIDDRETATSGHTQLYFARSTDGGLTFLPPLRASIMPDDKGGSCECCNTSIAVSLQGNVFISFRSDVDDNRDIYIARSLDGGSTFRSYKAASESWFIPACPMTGSSICIDREQTAHVVWRDSRPSSNGKDYIYYTTLRRDQNACPPDRRISDSPKKSNYPSITMTPDGALVCAYQDNRNDMADIFYTTSLDGGETFGPGVKLSRETNASKQEMPILRIAPDGTRYVVWQDSRRDEGDIVLARDTTSLMASSSVGDDVGAEAGDLAIEVDKGGQTLIVRLRRGWRPIDVNVFTGDGRRVRHTVCDGESTRIDVDRLPQGLYLVTAGEKVIPVSIIR